MEPPGVPRETPCYKSRRSSLYPMSSHRDPAKSDWRRSVWKPWRSWPHRKGREYRPWRWRPDIQHDALGRAASCASNSLIRLLILKMSRQQLREFRRVDFIIQYPPLCYAPYWLSITCIGGNMNVPLQHPLLQSSSIIMGLPCGRCISGDVLESGRKPTWQP